MSNVSSYITFQTHLIHKCTKRILDKIFCVQMHEHGNRINSCYYVCNHCCSKCTVSRVEYGKWLDELEHNKHTGYAGYTEYSSEYP